MKSFKGLYTALVTPFDESGNIDYKALDKILGKQIAAKVDGLVILGTTGESPTISEDERHTMFDFIKKRACGKTALILGTGSNNTETAIKETKAAEKMGADGVLVVNPYYNKPSQQGLFLHFAHVAQSTKLPVILYNIQGRTAVNLETSTLLRLVEAHKNIVAVKEASGDLSQMMQVLAGAPKNFSVLSGDDALTFSLMGLGGRGVVSVLSNLMPKEMKSLVDAAAQGDWKKAKNLHFKLLSKMQGCFIGGNPVAIKTAMAMRGLILEKFRLPLAPVDKCMREKIQMVFGCNA